MGSIIWGHSLIGRRQFLRNSVAGAGCFLFSRSAPFAAAGPAGADSRIELLPGEPLGEISPNIYGHFAENLGGVIYDGIWSARTRRSQT